MSNEVATYLQHESLYRGDAKIERRKKLRILLCGLGALGSWLSDLLARQGYWAQTGLDSDKVEDENFGTQNYGKQDVGRLKTAQVRLNAFRRLGVVVTDLNKRLTPTNATSIVKKFDLVVDLFDNPESRKAVDEACRKVKTPCLHAGLAAMGYFEVKWDDVYKVPTLEPQDEDAPCEYPMAANLVMMCVATTAEVINRWVDDDEKINVELWFKPLKLDIV